MGEHSPAVVGGPAGRWVGAPPARSTAPPLSGQRLEGGVHPARRIPRFPGEGHLLIPRFPCGAASPGSQPPAPGRGAERLGLAGLAVCGRGGGEGRGHPCPNHGLCCAGGVGERPCPLKQDPHERSSRRPQPGTLPTGRARLLHLQAKGISSPPFPRLCIAGSKAGPFRYLRTPATSPLPPKPLSPCPHPFPDPQRRLPRPPSMGAMSG